MLAVSAVSHYNSSSVTLPPVAIFNPHPQLVPLPYHPIVADRRTDNLLQMLQRKPETAADFRNGRYFQDGENDDVDADSLKAKRRRHERRQRDGGPKKRWRRHLNIHRSNEPNTACLRNKSSQSCLRFDDRAGMVSVNRHGTSASDPATFIDIILLCQTASAILGRCPFSNTAGGVQNVRPNTDMPAMKQVPRVVLLQFNVSKRYLCIDQHQEIVLRETLDNVEECALQHDLVGGAHEVFYSWKYPTSSPPESPCDGYPCSPTYGKSNVERRWYLGVSASGQVKTFNSRGRPKSPDSSERVFHANKRAYFDTVWIRSPSTQSSSINVTLPYSFTQSTALPTANPCFSSHRPATTTRRPSKSSRCSPLLKDCQRHRSSSSRSSHRKSHLSSVTVSPPASSSSRRRTGSIGAFSSLDQAKQTKATRTGRYRSRRAAALFGGHFQRHRLPEVDEEDAVLDEVR